jgi:excisionase family DNA binding protein
MTTTSTPPQLLSVTSAAEQLDCSRGHIYGLIAAGQLHAVDIAAKGTRAKTRVLASEIADLITSRTRLAI